MKRCVYCNQEFAKRSREGHKDFALRRFCGNECLRLSLMRSDGLPRNEPRGTYFGASELRRRVHRGGDNLDTTGIMHMIAEGRRR